MFIATYENYAGHVLKADDCETFFGPDFRATTLTALSGHGLTEFDIPEVIEVDTIKGYVTENDENLFWTELISTYLEGNFEWGYGSTKQAAIAHALSMRTTPAG